MNHLIEYMKVFVESSVIGFKSVFSADVDVVNDSNGECKIEILKAFASEFPFIVQVPFSGIVSGDYFLCVEPGLWNRFINDSLGIESEAELRRSAGKEFLNTVVGNAIVPLCNDFPGLTYSAPRVIEGSVDYPLVRIMKSCLTHPVYGRFEIILSIDLMQQEIGAKLEEEVNRAIHESRRAKKAEHTIQSILDNINLGILKLDFAGMIQPGCSSILAALFFRPLSTIIEQRFVDVCPSEVMAGKEKAFASWLKLVEKADPRKEFEWTSLMRTRPLREVEFVKDGKAYTYGFSYFPMADESDWGLLVIVEEITHRRLLEKWLMEETAAKVTLENRLKMANAVQKSLLPDRDSLPGIDIAASYHPAEEIGGDWYGYFLDRSSNVVDIFMGDVTGHGVSAALLTAVSCGAIYSIEMMVERLGLSFSGDSRLALIANILDRVIRQTGGGQKVMSMVFMSLDLASGQLSYLNAGHLPGFIVHPRKRTVKTILGPGSLLGSVETGVFAKRSVQLHPGDIVFLFTDGLIENLGPDGECIKLKRLRDILATSGTPGDTLRTVLKNAHTVWQDAQGVDDVALMAFRWNGPVTRKKDRTGS